MKTNKSYKKRLKATKSGKLIGRKTGQNHFNAKESRRSRIKRKKGTTFNITSKSRSRFIA